MSGNTAPSPSVDDVWASMKATVAHDLHAQKTRLQRSQVKAQEKDKNSSLTKEKIGRARASPEDTIESLLAKANAQEALMKQRAKKLQAKQFKERLETVRALVGNEISAEDAFVESPEVSESAAAQIVAPQSAPTAMEAKDMLQMLSRDLQRSADSDNVAHRRAGLQSVHDLLFVQHKLSPEGYSEVFQDICKSIFKRFNDSAERCRELSMRITQQFFLCCCDLTLSLGYFMPSLLARMPAGLAYDDEMKVFVFDVEEHEAYRRGVATQRADKNNLNIHTVVEPSEEIRLLNCVTLSTLLQRVCALGAASVLHPYFHDAVLYLQAQLRDPFPDLKQAASDALRDICLVEDFAVGMKYFSVALCRAILPVLRHRHAKVRVSALQALTKVMSVPDRAKQKGAGTEAIVDLVGFREENVLSVAAFYTSDVSINYLAEAVQDSCVPVRLAVAQLLTVLLTEIGDRYDHQTRLLPYLLDLLCDEAAPVSALAMQCLTLCGRQYEDDHQDEIIERRQYGVDGDRRINLSKPLPAPFDGRPRIGVRLYVRSNCKRFLNALVAELTNWMGATRLKSANLLRLIVVFMEEHLTMEAHALLPAFLKALGFATDQYASDKELKKILLDTYELVGRFMLPEVYVHYILPRLTGDPSVVQFGVDVSTRVTVLEFLGALLTGSQPREIAPQFEIIVSALTDPFVVAQDSVKTLSAALDVMQVLLQAMVGKGQAAVEAHFLNTGRLTSLQGAVGKVFRWLLVSLLQSEHDVHTRSLSCLQALSGLLQDSGACMDHKSLGVLFAVQGNKLIAQLLASFSCADDEWDDGNVVHAMLVALVGSPWGVLHADAALVARLLDVLLESVHGLRGSYEGKRKTEVLCYLSDLLYAALLPIVFDAVQPSSSSAQKMFQGLLGRDHASKSQPCGSACWPGTRRLFSEEHVALLRSTIAQKIPVLTAAFVQHGRWGKARSLQHRRLRLLAVLLGLGRPAELHQGASPLLRGEHISAALTHAGSIDSTVHVPTLLQVALSAPRVASSPAGLRLLGVQTTHGLLALLQAYWTNPATDEEAKLPSLTRLRSFQYWGSSQLASDPWEVVLQRRQAAQAAAAEGLAGLIHALSDSTNAVRAAACMALQEVLSLLSDSGDASTCFASLSARVVQELLRSLTLNTSAVNPFPVDAGDDRVQEELEWQAIGISAELAEDAGEAACVDLLRDCVRLLAVLDPGTVHAQLSSGVQELLPPLTLLQQTFKEPLPPARDIVNELLDHCSILMQLQAPHQ